MELTRREALAAGAAVPLRVQPLQASPAPGPHSLDALARQSGRRFGSAVGWGSARRERAAASPIPLMRRSSSANASCWCRRTSSNGSGSGARPDAVRLPRSSTRSPITRRRTGFKLRGHTLFWTPDQMVSEVAGRTQFGSAAEAERLLANARADGLPPLRRRASIPTTSSTRRCSPRPAQIRDTNVTRALGGEALPRPHVPHGARGSAACPARLQRLYELGAHRRGRDAHRTACSSCSKASASAARRSTRSASSRTSGC